MNHRPSSLPMLAVCPKFSSGTDDREHADQGTARHAILAASLRGEDIEFLVDSEEDREAITWAADYVRLHAPMADYPLVAETTREWTGPNFEPRRGTPDYVCGPTIFDFKWRDRDYTAQMADYALSLLDKFERATCHIMFGATRRVEVIEFDINTAGKIVGDILRKADDPNAKPNPCDYCGWCAHRLTCPAVLDRVNAVVEGRIDWKIDTYHSSEIASREQMGKALTIARAVGKWAEAVEHHAKQAAKRGDIPDGYSLKEKRGNRYVSSVLDAFARAGIPQDEFLKACEVSFADLVQLHASRAGLSKAASEREIERRLGETLQRKPNSVSLVAVKQSTNEN